jgi:hypothetical protein
MTNLIRLTPDPAAREQDTALYPSPVRRSPRVSVGMTRKQAQMLARWAYGQPSDISDGDAKAMVRYLFGKHL